LEAITVIRAGWLLGHVLTVMSDAGISASFRLQQKAIVRGSWSGIA
jgi:hypothetical protein